MAFREGVMHAVLAAVLVSCSAGIDVPRAEVPRLAELGASGSVEVDNGGRRVRIEREMAPDLTIKRNVGCSFSEGYSDAFGVVFGDSSRCWPVTTFPLEQLTVDQDKIVLPASACASTRVDLVHAPKGFVGSSQRNWSAWGGIGYGYLF
jgi:hypothetical protein